MFLRCKVRRKDGKQHRYWSVVENTRVAGGRVVQRHVLYLGEINDSQELAWRRSIEVLEDGATRPRTLSLFPEDRCAGVLSDASIVQVKLSQLQLRRPRQWGCPLSAGLPVIRRCLSASATGAVPRLVWDPAAQFLECDGGGWLSHLRIGVGTGKPHRQRRGGAPDRWQRCSGA